MLGEGKNGSKWNEGGKIEMEESIKNIQGDM